MIFPCIMDEEEKVRQGVTVTPISCFLVYCHCLLCPLRFPTTLTLWSVWFFCPPPTLICFPSSFAFCKLVPAFCVYRSVHERDWQMYAVFTTYYIHWLPFQGLPALCDRCFQASAKLCLEKKKDCNSPTENKCTGGSFPNYTHDKVTGVCWRGGSEKPFPRPLKILTGIRCLLQVELILSPRNAQLAAPKWNIKIPCIILPVGYVMMIHEGSLKEFFFSEDRVTHTGVQRSEGSGLVQLCSHIRMGMGSAASTLQM